MDLVLLELLGVYTFLFLILIFILFCGPSPHAGTSIIIAGFVAFLFVDDIGFSALA